jgi:hypothetical protein
MEDAYNPFTLSMLQGGAYGLENGNYQLGTTQIHIIMLNQPILSITIGANAISRFPIISFIPSIGKYVRMPSNALALTAHLWANDGQLH